MKVQSSASNAYDSTGYASTPLAITDTPTCDFVVNHSGY